MNKVTYSNASSAENSQLEPRDKMQSLTRGAREKCPNCGEGSLFSSYLKVADRCDHCGEELHHQRSDDAAPYFTILILGHLIVPLLLIVETYFAPAYWVYALIGIPMVVALTLPILQRVKGAVIGWQWALYMHGFDPDHVSEYPSLSSSMETGSQISQ